MRFLSYIAIVFLLLSLTVGEARGYHVPPWDTGHNSFDPDPGDDGTDPGTDDGCNSCPCSQKTGSPVEVASGNFIYSFRPLLISGLGPAIDLTLTYNSSDLRRGPFGVGWVHPYEQRIVEVVDEGGMGEVLMYAICAKSNGKRERFIRAQDGSYISPPYVFSKLTKNADGTFTLRDKYGMVQRFNTQGLLSAIVDRNGNTLSLTYDATGFMTKITDAAGRVVTLAKGADGRVESITDPANRVLRFGYDTAGNLTSYKDPLGNSHTYKYDTANNLTAMVDPRGNTQQSLTYDSARRVARHVEGAETWTYTYSPTQKRTIKRDSGNNAWTYDYNENGNVTKITDPVGKTEQYVLDANFNVIQFTDKNGNSTKYTYDSLGNQLSAVDALNNSRKVIYDPAFNRPLSMQDGLGNTTRFEYDGKGNLTKSINALGHTSLFEYNSNGQIVKITDSIGNSSSLTYDNRGNLSQTIDSLGNSSKSTFDILGKIVSTTDAEGRFTQFVYNDGEQLTRTTNALGEVTLKEYDSSGNMTAITLPSGTKTTFQYDSLNRLAQFTNPLGQSTNFTYDRRNNLATKTDAKGQIITYSYDALARLTRKAKPDDVVTYNYDGVGNLTNVVDGDSNLSFVYDALNRLTETRTAATPGQVATTVKFSYDGNGDRKTMTDPSGGVTAYTYDALSRLASISDPSGSQFGFSYDALSRRTKMDRPLGQSTSYGYDAASRLTSLTHLGASDNTTINYTYDKAGNRLTMTDRSGLHAYTYDPLYRLTSATLASSSNQESYSYDKSGNRVSSHLSASYSYNAANRLTADTAFNYTFDANGNLTRKTEKASGKFTTYTYDSENLLIRIDFADSTNAKYRYDGWGRRIEKNVNGKLTRYVYDGQDILFEYDGTGLVARYTHGPGIDEVLSTTRNGNTLFFRGDALGSIIAVVEGGSLRETYVYDSFGRITNQTGTRGSPYGFQNREFDLESGLYYFRARYYDPQIGIFLSEDPTAFFGGKNFYSFANNNPTNFTDPSGKIAFVPIILGAWAIFEVASSVYDIYDTTKTVLDPCESTTNKIISLGGLALGVVAPGGGYGAGGKAAKDFFKGTRYTDKVLEQAKRGDFHSFPDIVENFADAGRVKKITGGDGVTREMLEIPGEYKGRTGVFEFIKEADGSINHRYFRPNDK